ncbi:alpha/beta hydrolase [Pelagibacterium sp.]|uniref:alpha/beta hydrolase n=1 Tax=Pelagibacterium sp. TaxID=1967288 RepID=UPI003A950AD3
MHTLAKSLVLTMAALLANPASAQKISVETLVSPALANDDNPQTAELSYALYLPEGFAPEGNVRYPVVYLLHGSGGESDAWDAFWPILDAMIADGTIPPTIAVAPVTGNSYWVDSAAFGAIESAFIEDLIPHIDETLPTIAAREGRALAGFSMGGYGAARYGLAYPDVFSAATLLSPALQQGQPPATAGAVGRGSFGEPYDPARWDELNYPALVGPYASQNHRVPFFIVAGDDDWNHLSEKEDLPDDATRYNMEVQAVAFYTALHRENIFGADFEKWEDVPASPAELRIVDGGHGMDVWSDGFRDGLIYMFANGVSASIEN